MQNFELPSELFAALIGVVIALLLTAAGWLINSTAEQSKWLRNERLRIYLLISRNCTRMLTLEAERQKLWRRQILLSKSIDECEIIVNELSSKSDHTLTHAQKLAKKRELDAQIRKNRSELEEHRELGGKLDDKFAQYFDELEDLSAEFSILTSFRMARKLHKFLAHSKAWADYDDTDAFDRDTKAFNSKKSKLWVDVTNTAKRDLGAQFWLARLLRL